MHPEIIAVLVAGSLGMLAWSFRLAYRAAVVITKVEDRLDDHELRLRTLERRRTRSDDLSII